MDIMQKQMDSYFDLNSLDRLRQESAKGEHKSALRKVANQFESIFMRQMLKSMRDASFGDPLFDSNSTSFYRDMHDDQLALELSKTGSIGLADMIVKQLDPMVNGNKQPENNGRLFDIKRGPMSIHQQDEQKAMPIQTHKQMPIDRKAVTLPYIRPMQSDSTPVSAPKADKNTFDGKPETFINKMMPMAEKVARNLGTDARALVAQAGLETGWGKSMVQTADGKLSHNLFNIKADQRWDGERMWKQTLEFDAHGLPGQQKAAFRAYNSYEASFEDYVTFLRSSSRYNDAVRHAGDGDRFVEELQKAGYATDPDYASKIKRIMVREPLLNAAQG